MRARCPRLPTALAVLALTACSAGDPVPDPAPDPARSSRTPASEPTTLASYETEGVAVSRSPFCDRVSPTGIEHALGDAARSHRDYGNGDPLRLPDGSRSIAHEYGCVWTGADGATARAWVFAPPITRGRARRLADAALVGRCVRTGTGEFGSPSVTARCRTEDGLEASWRGLFGDAWLVCSLTDRGSFAALEERTSEWCVAVLEAART